MTAVSEFIMRHFPAAGESRIRFSSQLFPTSKLVSQPTRLLGAELLMQKACGGTSAFSTLPYYKLLRSSGFERLTDRFCPSFFPSLSFSGGHQGGPLLPAVFAGSVYTAGGDRRRIGVPPRQGIHHIAPLRSQAGHAADAVSKLRLRVRRG